MSSLMRDFIDEIRVLAINHHDLRTPASRNEFVLGYLETFFENQMDDQLRDKIVARMDDLKETSQ